MDFINEVDVLNAWQNYGSLLMRAFPRSFILSVFEGARLETSTLARPG